MTRATIARRIPGAKPPTVKVANQNVSPHPQIHEASGQAAVDRSTLFHFKTKPGYYNATAKAALLRREKSGPHDELFVDFSRPDVGIELEVGGRRLASGHWTWQATIAESPLTAAGSWSEVCWHREDLCDYLEIELPLSGGWRIERHMLLARHDRFLLLADALLGPSDDPASITYEQSLPLRESAAFEAARETREGVFISGGRGRALALPLALGEWRAELALGELTGSENRVTLKSVARGRRLYSPLWIDLDPRRIARPLTWRRLSVGENLNIVPPDIAAGYRIQAGAEQWLVYRSLTDFGNRSVLGHNTAYSFICGRIKRDGNFDPILEIE